VLLVVTLFASLMGGLLPTPSPAKAASSNVHLSAPKRVDLGEPIDVSIALGKSRNVGGFEAMLRFDTSAAQFAGVSYTGNSVEAVGRGIAGLGPIERPEGAAFGLHS